MNILHIISAPASGGAEVYIKDLAKYLSSQRHVLHVAFLSSAKDAGRDMEYEKYFLEDLRLSGVQTYIIGNETRKKPWLGISRITKYVSKHNIEICHTHLAYGIIFSAFLKIPVIYTHHTIQPRWSKSVYTIFNKIVDKYVGISDKCARALTRYSGREVTTIFNAVYEEKFSGYTRLRSPKMNIRVAMVGRLTPQKDYKNMIEAIALLDFHILEKIQIVIAGEGSSAYKKELQDLVASKNLEDYILFCGVIENIPKFLYEADIFLMTSAWEGLPIALTEASISGLPCIVTDVGGCSEVIETSKNGVVIPAHNPKKISESLTRLVQYPEVLQDYSANALKNSHLYSISKAADLHIQLYSEVINN